MATANEIREQQLQIGNVLGLMFVHATSHSAIAMAMNSIIIADSEKAVKLHPVNAPEEVSYWVPKKALIFKKVKGTSERKGNIKYDVSLAQWFYFDSYQLKIWKEYADVYID